MTAPKQLGRVHRFVYVGLHVDLQLVELVLQDGQSQCAHRDHHEPTTAARGRGKGEQSGGQTTLYLTLLYGKVDLIKTLIANIREALRYVKGAEGQIKSADPWGLLLRYVSDKIAPIIGLFRPATG